LKEGALFVLTIDLFLDLTPFTENERNEWGTNVSIKWLVEQSKMKLVQGDEEELFGFPGFEPRRIIANLDRYYVGQFCPSLVQMVILQK
jgi:hypothetical protein